MTAEAGAHRAPLQLNDDAALSASCTIAVFCYSLANKGRCALFEQNDRRAVY